MSRFSRHQPKFITAADQAASSATNFGGSALAAGLLSSTDFGAYAVAVAAYLIVLGFVRTWTSDVLMVEAPGMEPNRIAHLASGAVTVSALMGVAGGAAIASAALVNDGRSSSALVALAVCLPVLTVQDTCRFCAIVQGRPSGALRSDLCWFVVAIAGLMVLRRTDTALVALAVLAWAAAALPAAFLGVRVTASRLELSTVMPWLRSARRLSLRLSSEFAVVSLGGFTTLVLLTGLSNNLADAGALRSAQVVLGPLTVLFAASTMYLQPIMVRRHIAHQKISSIAQRQSGINTAAAVVWLSIALLIPSAIGVRVFGASWAGASAVQFLVGVPFIGLALSSGPITALRSRRQLNSGLALQVTVTAIVLVCTAIGLVSDSTHGELKGFAIGNLVGGCAAWVIYLRWPGREVRSFTSADLSREAIGLQ